MNIVIGTIVKPQGIKGEVKVKPYTDNVERFNNLKCLNIDNSYYDIENVRSNGRDVFIKLKDISDRNTAETLRGKNIQIPYNDIEKPKDKDRYLICDLISSRVISDGKDLGVLNDILQNGAADVYVVKGKRNFMFPALKDLIIDVDIERKTIELDPNRLSEVIVYED